MVKNITKVDKEYDPWSHKDFCKRPNTRERVKAKIEFYCSQTDLKNRKLALEAIISIIRNTFRKRGITDY